MYHRYPYFVPMLFGLATAVLAVTFPPLPKVAGIASPMLALEFAESGTEVARITRQFDADVVKALRANLAHDRFFIFAYVGFLLFTALTAWRQNRRHLWALLAAILAFATGYFDREENRALYLLLDQQNGAALTQLKWFTWLKWGGLTGVFALLGPLVWPTNKTGKGLVVFTAMTAIAGLSGWFNPSIRISFANLVMLLFLLLFVWEMQQRNPDQ